MPHSVTPAPDGTPMFRVLSYSWPADSIPHMTEAVDELRTMLEDAEVILSNLRDRQLGLMDTTDDATDLLDRIHEQEQDELYWRQLEHEQRQAEDERRWLEGGL